MKSRAMYMFIVLLFSTVSITKGTGRSEIRLVQNRYEYKSGYVYIGISTDLGKAAIGPRQSVIITPTLSRGDNTVRLPAIIINGKAVQRLYKRGEVFHEKELPQKDTDVVINYNRKAEPETAYLVSLPYENWMDNATLYVQEELRGSSSREHLVLVEKLNGPHTGFPAAQVEKAVPLPAVQKPQEKDTVFSIRFAINLYDVNTGFNGNKEKFKAIGNLMEQARDGKIVLKSISLTGYASVEGPYQYNRNLSRNRAMSLKDYLEEQYHLPASVFKTSWEGEDWKGMVKALSESGMPDKERILEIIRTTPVPGREAALRQLNHGEKLLYMEKHFFAPLRRVAVSVRYVPAGENK